MAITGALCYVSYGIGYRRALGINYAEVSKQARTWIEESGELLKRKWSDSQ
jgi:hypothetical protein